MNSYTGIHFCSYICLLFIRIAFEEFHHRLRHVIPLICNVMQLTRRAIHLPRQVMHVLHHHIHLLQRLIVLCRQVMHVIHHSIHLLHRLIVLSLQVMYVPPQTIHLLHRLIVLCRQIMHVIHHSIHLLHRLIVLSRQVMYVPPQTIHLLHRLIVLCRQIMHVIHHSIHLLHRLIVLSRQVMYVPPQTMKPSSPSYTSTSTSTECNKKRRKYDTQEIWPNNEQDIVRHLIIKQKFNGLWSLDIESVEKLTEKPFNVFQITDFQIDKDALITAIIIVVLETRFTVFKSLWHGIVQKARSHLTQLFGDEPKTLKLLDEIHKQL